jgi:glycosyltransferase involved in cell wall biosynthesis
MKSIKNQSSSVSSSNRQVSIYIISRDRPKYLRRAINSCLSQSYSALEIIVVDDSSDSFSIFEFAKEFNEKTVQFYRTEVPSGANVCRNIALKKSSGEFITGLDDDDFFTPKRIELMLKTYLANKDSVCAVSSRHLFESVLEKRGIKNSIKYSLKWITTLVGRDKIIQISDVLNKNNIGNQVFTEKSRLVDCGGFDEELPALQDYETWLRLMKKYGPILRINKFLYIKNDELDSITNVNRKKLLGFDYIYNKHHELFKNREHCFYLHRALYEHKYLNLKQAISYFKPGNYRYILYLLVTFRVRFS